MRRVETTIITCVNDNKEIITPKKKIYMRLDCLQESLTKQHKTWYVWVEWWTNNDEGRINEGGELCNLEQLRNKLIPVLFSLKSAYIFSVDISVNFWVSDSINVQCCFCVNTKMLKTEIQWIYRLDRPDETLSKNTQQLKWVWGDAWILCTRLFFIEWSRQHAAKIYTKHNRWKKHMYESWLLFFWFVVWKKRSWWVTFGCLLFFHPLYFYEFNFFFTKIFIFIHSRVLF